MKSSPREATNERPFALFKTVDAAMCDSKGVYVIAGNLYYHFENVMIMVGSRVMPKQHRVSLELFGCDH